MPKNLLLDADMIAEKMAQLKIVDEENKKFEVPIPQPVE